MHYTLFYIRTSNSAAEAERSCTTPKIQDTTEDKIQTYRQTARYIYQVFADRECFDTQE